MFYKLISYFDFRGKNRIRKLLGRICLSKDHMHHPGGYPSDRVIFSLNRAWEMESQLLFCGIPESFLEDLNFIKSNYHKKGAIVDIGANIGLYSLFFSKELHADVIAFEPVQEVFLRLKKNILLNNASVIAESVAVGDVEGTTKMFIPSDLKTDSGLSSTTKENSWMKFDNNCLPITVPAITLDDYCKRSKVNDIGLIKIDVEGTELAVLRGAAETIKKNSPDILFEVNGDFWGDYEKPFVSFSRLLPDYEIYFQDRQDKTPVREAILSRKIRNGNWWAVKH